MRIANPSNRASAIPRDVSLARSARRGGTLLAASGAAVGKGRIGRAMVSRMSKLTAFLIVRNAERQLPRCLASLRGVVDAVTLLDTGSEDGTVAILDQAAADPAGPPLSWQSRHFDDFGRARRAALSRVTTPWALWIDADEALSGPLRERLAHLRASGELQKCDVWKIRMENRVLGRIMRGRNLAHQYRARLFRVGYADITDSHVHEGLVQRPDAKVGTLEEPLLHEAMSDWRSYLRKVDRYTSLETLKPSRYGRWLPLHLLITAPATLWREYIVRGGWRDGWPGFVWAATTAWSSVLRDLKHLARWVRSSTNSPD
jgi:glycosyltransferase involved in cell wall biosynthesis